MLPCTIIIIIIVYHPFSMLRTGWSFSPNQAPEKLRKVSNILFKLHPICSSILWSSFLVINMHSRPRHCTRNANLGSTHFVIFTILNKVITPNADQAALRLHKLCSICVHSFGALAKAVRLFKA